MFCGPSQGLRQRQLARCGPPARAPVSLLQTSVFFRISTPTFTPRCVRMALCLCLFSPRQGCILAPVLVALFLDYIVRVAFANTDALTVRCNVDGQLRITPIRTGQLYLLRVLLCANDMARRLDSGDYARVSHPAFSSSSTRSIASFKTSRSLWSL